MYNFIDIHPFTYATTLSPDAWGSFTEGRHRCVSAHSLQVCFLLQARRVFEIQQVIFYTQKRGKLLFMFMFIVETFLSTNHMYVSDIAHKMIMLPFSSLKNNAQSIIPLLMDVLGQLPDQSCLPGKGE